MSKRALVVDDSRSARVILSRLLEAHDFTVDSAESAEQALEYLKHTVPDVVFMDHLMPGMDGFAAVRAIKSEARTANTPVMMYTSQEGQSYLREALAVGAAGALSKTLTPADVARALYHLRLLPDRRDTPPVIPASMPDAPRADANEAMPAQFAELKRSLEESLEHAARRIGNELRSAIQIPPQLAETVPTRARAPRGLIAALLVFALLPMLISAALLWRVMETGKTQLDQANARLSIVVAEQQTQIEFLRAELRKRDQAAIDASAAAESAPTGEAVAPLKAPPELAVQ